MTSTFEKTDDGLLIIRCDNPINGCDSHVFTPETIASWKALLGLASTRETIAAIMQGREDTTRYDPSTGRGIWTTAYEALESALADSASEVSMLSDDGEVMDDPLTAARNTAREGMNLPTMSNDMDARLIAVMSNDMDEEPSSGIDVGVTEGIEGLDEFLENEDNREWLDAADERFYMGLMPRQNQEGGAL